MKRKRKLFLVLIIITIIGTIVGVSYYFYSSKTLLVKIDNNIEVSINEAVYNTDYIKVIANGEIITKKEQIDTTKVGEQVIKITVKDYFNKEKDYSYKLNVYDKEHPVITYTKEHTTDYVKEIDYLKQNENTNSNTIKDNNILGIFDLDNTTVSKATREYINTAEKNGECIYVSIEELPKSFIVTTENEEKKIYISPLNTSTIFKRIK